MALPATPKVEIRFGTGASFGNALVLGSPTQGILGTNVLGTSAAVPIDVTSLVQLVNIRRGRDRVFDHYEAGTAVVSLLDQTGDYNPQNASGPYYGDILPMRQLRISASYSGADYWLFSGYITSWDYEWPVGADFARVTIVAEDGFRLFNLAEVDDIPGAAAGDLPAERISQVLDAIDWPASQTTINGGSITLQDDPGGIRPALQVLQQVEDTELGALYMAANGNLTFKGRSTLSVQATGTKTYFDDTGTNVQYQAIDVTLDDTELANDVTVSRVGGTAQNAQSPISIEQFFRRSLTRSGLLMETDDVALQQANSVLNYRKDVELLVRSVGVDLSSPSNRVAAALGLELGDPIQVIRTQPGGSTMTADLTVQGVTHQITPETWFTTISTALPLGTAFVLGSSEFGILGTSTL
jgi:hypothetical protein